MLPVPRKARIDTGLQHHLLDLVSGQAVVQCAAQMRLQLMRAAQRDQDRAGDQRTMLQLQPRSGPDRRPGMFRDQLLQVGAEIIGLGQCRIDIGITGHGAADCQALLEQFTLELGAVGGLGHGTSPLGLGPAPGNPAGPADLWHEAPEGGACHDSDEPGLAAFCTSADPAERNSPDANTARLPAQPGPAGQYRSRTRHGHKSPSRTSRKFRPSTIRPPPRPPGIEEPCV